MGPNGSAEPYRNQNGSLPAPLPLGPPLRYDPSAAQPLSASIGGRDPPRYHSDRRTDDPRDFYPPPHFDHPRRPLSPRYDDRRGSDRDRFRDRDRDREWERERDREWERDRERDRGLPPRALPRRHDRLSNASNRGGGRGRAPTRSWNGREQYARNDKAQSRDRKKTLTDFRISGLSIPELDWAWEAESSAIDEVVKDPDSPTPTPSDVKDVASSNETEEAIASALLPTPATERVDAISDPPSTSSTAGVETNTRSQSTYTTDASDAPAERTGESELKRTELTNKHRRDEDDEEDSNDPHNPNAKGKRLKADSTLAEPQPNSSSGGPALKAKLRDEESRQSTPSRSAPSGRENSRLRIYFCAPVTEAVVEIKKPKAPPSSTTTSFAAKANGAQTPPTTIFSEQEKVAVDTAEEAVSLKPTLVSDAAASAHSEAISTVPPNTTSADTISAPAATASNENLPADLQEAIAAAVVAPDADKAASAYDSGVPSRSDQIQTSVSSGSSIKSVALPAGLPPKPMIPSSEPVVDDQPIVRPPEPAADRISISYARNTRRIVVDAAIVSQVRIYRADNRIEVAVNIEASGSQDGDDFRIVRGILVC